MKALFATLLVCTGYFVNAQAYRSNDLRHEVKFNIGMFLVNTSIETAYEYYFSEDASIGGTLYFNGDATKFNGDFGIGPNLRAYFGYAPKSGLFAEAFLLYYTGKKEIESAPEIQRLAGYGTTAIGLGLGNKWTTYNQRVTFELTGGLGRNLDPEDFQDKFMFRAGLSIGLRF